MLRAGLHMVFCLGFHALSMPSLSDMSQDQNAEPILQFFRGDCFLLTKTTWGNHSGHWQWAFMGQWALF